LRLGDELRSYGEFLQRIGVKESPDADDAFTVMQEISATAGNSPVDPEARAVLWNCWEMVERALRDERLTPEEIESRLEKVKCVPNRSSVLYAANLVFFDNRAGLAAKFGTFLRDHVIARPLGASVALSAAGVRELGNAIELEVLERREASPDIEMRELLDDRRDQIGRVFSAQGAEIDVSDAMQRLERLECEQTSLLKVQYQLSIFARTPTSNPEFPQALFIPSEETLSFTRDGDGVHWAAIARELAIAAFPEEDPGRFSSALKDVLSSPSVEDAAAILDELGYAEIDADSSGLVEPGGVAGGLGTDEPVGPPLEDEAWQPTEDEGHEAEEFGLARYEDGTRPGAPLTDEADQKGEEYDQDEVSDMGTDEPSSGSQTEDDEDDVDYDEGPALTGAFSGDGHGRGRRAGSDDSRSHDGTGKREDQKTLGSAGTRPFISYVSVDHEDKEEDPDGLSHQQRMDLEEKAILHILSLEPELERTPTHNPGFDLTEPDTDGETARWIEVKAMAGSLLDRPATMSHTQFKCAEACGDAYWLYVVEHTGTDPRLVKIQDPAGRARTFLFDRGWLAIAEFGSAETVPSTEVPGSQL
jgi:hypothetical protein